MSEKNVNKRIRKILEQDLAEAVADVLRAEAHAGPSKNVDQERECSSLAKIAELRAQTLGRFEASVRRGPPAPTPAPGGGAKWGDG